MFSPDLYLTELTRLTPAVLVGHLSYGLIVFAMLMRNIVVLRLFAVSAALCNIAFAALAKVEPNIVVITWQGLFITVNFLWIIKLLVERRGQRLSERETELWDTVFSGFVAFDAAKLMRLATWETCDEGQILARYGEKPEWLFFLYSGSLRLTGPGGLDKEMQAGSFVGEVAFLRGGGATANVTTAETTVLVRWSVADLTRLMRRNPGMARPMEAALSCDVLAKLVGDQGVTAVGEEHDGWLNRPQPNQSRWSRRRASRVRMG